LNNRQSSDSLNTPMSAGTVARADNPGMNGRGKW
jgi:hypothetical protein